MKDENTKKPKRLGEDRNVTFLEFNRVSSEDDPMKVEFKPAAEVYAAGKSACAHHHTWIDEKEHRLQCAGCKEILDPLTWLRRFAERERRLDWRVQAIKEYEKKAAEARVRDNRKRELKYRRLPQGRTRYGRVTVILNCIDVDKVDCKHEVYLSQLQDIKATEELHVTLEQFERFIVYDHDCTTRQAERHRKAADRLTGNRQSTHEHD